MIDTFTSARYKAAPLSLHVRSALLVMLGAVALPSFAQQAPAKSPAELSEILVHAKREDVTSTSNGTSTVISARQLEQNSAIDMGNIARYAPLVSVPTSASGSGNIWDGSGNTGFNIRGVEGNRVALELDGISLPDAAPKPDASSTNSFGIGRDYFEPETFREVRIGSGTSPSGAGTPGLGGSISFITKAPEDYLDGTHKLYADYKFGYTSDRAMRLHAVTAAAQISDTLKGLIVGVYRNGDKPESLSSVPLNPDDWNSDAVLAKLNWTIAKDQKLGFTIDSYKAHHGRAYDNKMGASYPNGTMQDSSTARNRYSIDHRYTPAGFSLFDLLDTKLYIQNSSSVDQTRANYISGGQSYLRNINTGFYNTAKGGAFDAGKQASINLLLNYGLSYEQLQSRRPWSEDRTVVKTGVHQITIKNRMADMDTDKLSAYLRGEYDFTLGGRQAILTAGLRGEQRTLTPQNLQNYLVAVPNASQEIKKETESFFTPSLNLSVDVAQGLAAYGQYTRGTRLPTAAERTGTFDSFSYTGAGNGYAVLGNPKLGKETSNAFELGLKGAPTSGVEVSASVFHTSYDNFIEYVAQAPDPVNYPTITFGLFRPENIGKAKIYGSEISWRFNFGQWSPAAKGTSLIVAGGVSRGTAANKDSGKKGQLASVQPYKANATLAWDDPAQQGGAAFVASTARGKRAEGDVLSGTTSTMFNVPGWTVFDLTAYWNLSKHITFSGGVYNLADKKYWDYATSRSLPAATTATTVADIERQARPGRNYAFNLKVIY